ncbi:hypothetical protein DES53_102874 [Roseimicrobium gellanilyticum]|uniref:Uncharacterized protein n=1 Tax=Roseimicrobium gellanilyticum TaxID=748857 RepID=A0A366HU71_9BACT|nr:hypothetical protein [Roseimicrobium gellanilyticum]RBP46483.1 hypothetical protein DES53_102874 [Roseimicrobium gellanilyticum]
MLRYSLLICALGMLTVDQACAKDRQAQVFRTFMPGAGPSAFGVVLNPEMALCYDPLRGGVNQAWRGTLDLSPTLRAKINEPAKIRGAVFYEETTVQPLRINDAGKVPERRFKGYSYEENGVTFSYTLDGIAIRETLLATADGGGLERHWSIPNGVTLFLITDPQAKAKVVVQGGAEVSRGTWKFVGAPDAAFFMKIQPDSSVR